jgi:hypothetical protein
LSLTQSHDLVNKGIENVRIGGNQYHLKLQEAKIINTTLNKMFLAKTKKKRKGGGGF